MMTPKEFYRTYQADDSLSEMSEKLCTLINQEGAVHAFEFGMGTGKHLRRLKQKGVEAFGMDISVMNCIQAQMSLLEGVALGDEKYLRHLVNFDVVFTVSVLDHIEYVDEIVAELKRICNISVFLAETNDIPGKYYYPHDYLALGFHRVPEDGVPFNYTGKDGATYNIWKWTK